MAFRFSRRISLFKGLRLNLSKSGTSVSVGGRGGWLTFGKKGTRATVGLPGIGKCLLQPFIPSARISLANRSSVDTFRLPRVSDITRDRMLLVQISVIFQGKTSLFHIYINIMCLQKIFRIECDF